jgi:hypothetical protein
LPGLRLSFWSITLEASFWTSGLIAVLSMRPAPVPVTRNYQRNLAEIVPRRVNFL